MAMTATAPACPMASLMTPITSGKMVPPNSPIIIRPETSFCLSGTESNASENAIEKMFEWP